MKVSKLEIAVLSGLIGLAAVLGVLNKQVTSLMYKVHKNYIEKLYK